MDIVDIEYLLGSCSACSNFRWSVCYKTAVCNSVTVAGQCAIRLQSVTVAKDNLVHCLISTVCRNSGACASAAVQVPASVGQVHR